MRIQFSFRTPLLVLCLALLAGCSKKEDTIVKKGSISGTYTPAGSAAGLVAIKQGTTVPIQGSLGADNTFKVTGLVPGDYDLYFTANAGFSAPAIFTTKVTSGKNTDAGTVIFQTPGSPTIPTGTASVSGKIVPKQAALEVRLSYHANAQSYPVVPDAEGNFKLTGLPAGTYSIYFKTATGYIPPAPKSFNLSSTGNTDLGQIKFDVIPATAKAIDTISGTILLSNQEMIDNFIYQTQHDSAIVLTQHIYLSRKISPELAKTLNKIIVIKGALMVSGREHTDFRMDGLKEVGQLAVSVADNLATVELPALKVATQGIVLQSCRALQRLELGALEKIVGSLEVSYTGLADFSPFKNATLEPFMFIVQGNVRLTSITGLRFVSDSVYNFTVSNNALLTTLDGVQGIRQIKNEADISNNPSLQSINGLNNIIVARRLVITNNGKLQDICPARGFINLLKDRPTYDVIVTNQFTGKRTTVKKEPLVAATNGSYATRADLVTAIGKCP